MTKLKDKNGIVIEEFDVLKVFHFIGARRKKYYVYKLVILWDGHLYGAHLDRNPLTPGYHLASLTDQDETLMDTEIVQSKNMEKLK
jgi:hypothetical protein